MSPYWQSVITMVVVPAITEFLKRWMEHHRDEKLPSDARIALPVLAGGVLQTGMAAMLGGDLMQGAALGVMAGGLASSGRDFIHKGLLGKHWRKRCNCPDEAGGC